MMMGRSSKTMRTPSEILRYAPDERETFSFRPYGVEIVFGIFPRTALRLTWAIFLRPSGADRSATCSYHA